MSDESIVTALENMLSELSYTPSPSYGRMTGREPERLFDLRCSKVSIAHPDLTMMDVEKLLLRVWLQLSMEYDEEPFDYHEYLHRQDEYADLITLTSTSKLRDIISTVEESLILD